MSPQPRRPHLLLITTDQQRGDALGLHGHPVLETPNLDALAARGTDFRRSYVTCPVCIPARRTLVSGQSPESHGLRHYQDHLEWDPPTTFPAELSRAGYQTQLVGKMHLHPQGKRYGYDHIILSENSHDRSHLVQRRNDYARWFYGQPGTPSHTHWHGIHSNGRLVQPWTLNEHLHHNAWLAQEACRFLAEDRDPSCPFFLHLSFFHPHPPLVPPQSYLDRYERKGAGPATLGDWCPPIAEGRSAPPRPAESATGPFAPTVIERARAAYFALLHHIDDCIARVLECWFEYQNPRAKEPIYILFSSDHGEMLGDHQLFRKSLGYEASARVPFFVSAANAPLRQGQSEALVCWEDIGPTLLGLAGLEVPPSMDGYSLAPYLREEQAAPPNREYIKGECGGQLHNLWITDATHKYLWFPKTGEEQLFDLQHDPHECHDLSGEDRATLDRMRTRLAREIEGREDLGDYLSTRHPCANQPPEIFWPPPLP